MSRFSAPLSYDFDPVLRVVERAVPIKFGSLDSIHQMPNDARRHYAFEADRGPFTTQARDSMVYLRTGRLSEIAEPSNSASGRFTAASPSRPRPRYPWFRRPGSS